MDERFERHLPLVRSLVSRYRGGYSEEDDLFQVGCIGLIKALRGFDPERGVAFATYAVPVIAGEIKMYLRGQGSVKYSRALKAQAMRIKKLQAELEQRLGRPPALSELAEASGLEREDLLVTLDALRLPLSLDAAEPGGQAGLSTAGGEEEMVDRVALREALANLPSRERQIVHCRFFEHKTQREVAELLGISQVHVSRLEKKVIRDLKELLGE
jgi:RNA polymerase sporulation-specific sigma factor